MIAQVEHRLPPPPNETSESLWKVRLFATFAALLVLQGLLLYRHSDSETLGPVLATQIAVLGPGLFIMVRSLGLKWASIYLTQICLAFGASLFFVEEWTIWGGPVLANPSNLVDAMAVSAVGVGACGVGIATGLARRRQSENVRPVSIGPLWGSWWFWFLSYWGTVWIGQLWDPGRLGYFGVMAAHWPLTAIIALDLLARAGRAPRRIKGLVWWVLVPLRMLLGLSTGFSGFFFNDGIPLLFYLTMRKVIRIRLYGAIICMVLILFAFNVRSHIREVVWESYGDDRSRLGIAYSSIMAVLEDFSIEKLDESLRIFAGVRIGHYVLVAHAAVVRETPEIVPYLYGETFTAIPWVMMPRFLYPEKPISSWGQRYGHRYRLLSPGDEMTSFNLPQMTEFYVNGGIWLVFALMFLVGKFVRWLSLLAERLCLESADVLWVVLPVVFGIINQSFSNVSLSFNAAVYNTLVLSLPTIVNRWLERRQFQKRAVVRAP